MNFNSFRKVHFFLAIPLVGLLVMLVMQSYLRAEPNMFYAPIIWLSAGIGTSVFLSLLWVESEVHGSQYAKLFAGISLLIGCIPAMYFLNEIIQAYPIVAAQSDVIPSLEVYAQRLLAGEKVYTAIPFDGYEVWPTYFPGMWLPYIIPESLGFDYRWMAFFSFYISISYITISLQSSSTSTIYAALGGLLPGLVITCICLQDESAFAFATELMPITYYMWLIYAISRKNLWLIGIFIALCTLSRYAYTLWIIPFVVIIWHAMGFRSLLKIGLVGTGTILILYVIPFLLADPAILTDGLAYYGKTAEDQWRTQAWQAEGEFPFHLANGLSFSPWTFDYIDGHHIEKLAYAKRLHLLISLVLSVGLTAFYFVSRKRVEWNNYLIWSLFLFLMFFYAFLYVPFSYLYLLPLMVGILTWVVFTNVDTSEPDKN